MIFSCWYRNEKAKTQHHVRPEHDKRKKRARTRVNNYDKRRIEEK